MATKQQVIHLACRECQRKKVKCSRTFPCLQCTRAGIACKVSTRKPRAKASKTGDAELRERIFKLERLVETFSGEDGNIHHEIPRQGSHAATSSLVGGEPRTPTTSTLDNTNNNNNNNNNIASTPVSPSDAAALETSKYVAGTFWSSLTAEVKALADVFAENGSQDEETPEESPYSTQHLPESSQALNVDFELIFCPPGGLYVMPGATLDPDPVLASQLFTAYLNHVDPIFKIFHLPSLKSFVLGDQPYLGYPHDAPCNKAIKAAIFFAGVNALSDDECVVSGRSRHEMVSDFRRMVDIALYQADPMRSTELATLQALVIYVASIRVLDSSRRSWTMVALLDRIGRGLGIHKELPGEPIYIREIRRRLWYSVIFLDCFSCYDRGSDPTIMPHTYNRPLPSNVNDDDFDENSTSLIPRQNEITDMSLALVAQECAILPLRRASSHGGAQTWQQDLQNAYEIQMLVNERYLRFCDPTSPEHETIKHTATAAVHCIFLRAVRPMQYDGDTLPPRVDSPWVMALALNILRHAGELWEQIGQRWRRMPWVPWHAIAVALAALCSVRDTPVADEAWILVDSAMGRYAPDVADGANGMLWRPIEKLYKKAAAFRDGVEMQQTQTPFPPQQAQQQQQQQQQQPLPPLMQGGSAFYPNHHPQQMTTQQDPPPLMGMLPISSGGDAATTMMMNLPNPMFDLSTDMMATLPISDPSWLDWESIIKDIGDVQAEDMQWM